MSVSCIACANGVGSPCCKDNQGQVLPGSQACGAGLYCMDGNTCGASKGHYHDFCSTAGQPAECDVADFPGLTCVAAPAGSAFANWCDCDASTEYKLCDTGKMCGPGSPAGPAPAGPAPASPYPSCQNVPNITDGWKTCPSNSEDAGYNIAGAATPSSNPKIGWTCGQATSPATISYIQVQKQTPCNFDFKPWPP